MWDFNGWSKNESQQANATELTGLLSEDAPLEVSPSASLDIQTIWRYRKPFDSMYCNSSITYNVAPE